MVRLDQMFDLPSVCGASKVSSGFKVCTVLFEFLCACSLQDLPGT